MVIFKKIDVEKINELISIFNYIGNTTEFYVYSIDLFEICD